ncbi:MAG: DUF2442 domain-containing protein [Dehalococcoidia bacterium]|nr:DUF2442 domain-containing protein [Dehalococcoidia bacterium]
MSTSKVRAITVLATDVHFDAERMTVQLSDGREISVPVEWFPALRDATEEQRNRWRLIGKGVGIHWEDLDEDLSVEGLLRC